MKFRSLALAATALLLPFAAAACSDDSTGDLDKGEVKDIYVDAGLPEDQADCLAERTIAEDFSKDEIEALGAAESDVDEDVQKRYMAMITECVTGDTAGS